jgi:hypothetical protein
VSHDSHEGNWVEALSVCGVIERRLDPADPWRLALVQRNELWEETRTARLLDSLLAGYPIGTLLVCRLRKDSHVIEQSPERRRARIAMPGTSQLLDGQQRVNALISLFSEHGKFGHFLVDMGANRTADVLGARRRDREASIRYIHWRARLASEPEPLDTRSRCVDLTRWRAWASEQSEVQLKATVQDDALLALHSLDPVFDPSRLAGTERDIAHERLDRLVDLWFRPSLPVQNLELDGPQDVLQVFTRINLEGVDVATEDMFFAAVKTLWPDVEEYLERLWANGAPSEQGQLDGVFLDRVSSLQGQNARRVVEWDHIWQGGSDARSRSGHAAVSSPSGLGLRGLGRESVGARPATQQPRSCQISVLEAPLALRAAGRRG